MTSRTVNDILELVGNTPLVRINRMNPVAGVQLLVKLESMNPGGSVKDRIALTMIEEAERAGELTAGKILLEASSGNTAIGLAMVCAVKGYQLLVTMSESASEERRRILRAYGAEILLTPGHLSTDGAIEEAYRPAREEPDKYVLADQFNNEANWQAHYNGTGKEIWAATGGRVDVVVLTMGTTGTLMGTTRVLKELDPTIRVVGVAPFKGHKIQGLKNMKESYAPGIFALGTLFAFVRHVNRLINDSQLDTDQAGQILDFMRQVNQILDIIDFDDGQPDLRVQRIVDERDKARSAGDFERADSLRAIAVAGLERHGRCVRITR